MGEPLAAASRVRAADDRVDLVYLVFKTHLDIGFMDLAANVVRGYFERFIPEAVRVARELRRRSVPEEAIAAGDVARHGLPFTTHSGFVDPRLFEPGPRLARELDARFRFALRAS